MTNQTGAPEAVPGLAGALAHLRSDKLGCIQLAFCPVDGRGLAVDVRPERLRDRDTIAGHAELAAVRWLAAVRRLGLLPLALDARLPARTLDTTRHAPVLSHDDVAGLVDRLRARVAATTGAGAPFPDVLIRVERGAHHVSVAGSDPAALTGRDALAAEVLGWVTEHGAWWDGLGTFAVKLEPDRA